MARGESRKKKTSRTRQLLVLTAVLLLAADVTVLLMYLQMRHTAQLAAEQRAAAESSLAEEERVRQRESEEAASLEALRLRQSAEAADAQAAETAGKDSETAPSVPEGFLEVQPAEQGVLRLSFAGDILFDERYAVMASLLSGSGGAPEAGKAFDEGLLSEMRSADLMIVNHEYPSSERGSALPDKKFTFRAKPAYDSLLLEMGVDAVSLANNHAFDYGEEALLDTLDTLDALGISRVGAGRNREEAEKPLLFYAEGKKIALLAATQIERGSPPDTRGATDTLPGVFRCTRADRLLEAVQKAKECCDFVIVFIHWGTESATAIDWMQEEQAEALAKAGADLIIGAHPHVLQQIAMVEGVPVVYSLGNFWFNSKTLDSGLVTAELELEGCTLQGLRFVPARQSGCRTVLLSGEEKKEAIKRMQALSGSVKLDGDGRLIF